MPASEQRRRQIATGACLVLAVAAAWGALRPSGRSVVESGRPEAGRLAPEERMDPADSAPRVRFTFVEPSTPETERRSGEAGRVQLADLSTLSSTAIETEHSDPFAAGEEGVVLTSFHFGAGDAKALPGPPVTFRGHIEPIESSR
jgi:hypothetical protein